MPNTVPNIQKNCVKFTELSSHWSHLTAKPKQKHGRKKMVNGLYFYSALSSTRTPKPSPSASKTGDTITETDRAEARTNNPQVTGRTPTTVAQITEPVTQRF
ncbi:hypothetical protein AMECASPLE_027705 [Ameca splendens]|uniref:Uncharacterized protein n=1 Tax=Ameca splendens TaxID=208324 RepID=A0ABV0XIF1_9TELE